MEFQSPQSSILDLSQSMDYINAHTNLAENSLQSHKPKGLHRPSTIHHTNLNNGGGIELNTELYQQESKKFGFSHFNSLNRASHINRRFYADGGLRNAPEEDLSRLLGLETDQFLMHWVGHLDNPVRESRTPRELKSYFHSYYENKGSSIDDFLLYMRSNPSAESKSHIRHILANRLTYLIGQDTQNRDERDFEARTEYSLEMMQKRIDRINLILSTNKPDRLQRAEKLINYQALIIQEAILLCTTLTYILELLGSSESQFNQIKLYSRKLQFLIDENGLKLGIIKSLLDELKYKAIQIKENTLKQATSISDITLPINLWNYSMRTPGVIDLLGDPRNFTQEQFQEMYTFSNTPKDSCPELKQILKGLLDKTIKESEGIRMLADLTEETFCKLIRISSS